MRLIKPISILFLILVICVASSTRRDDVAGLYVTKDPNFNDRLTIMYVRGYKNFLYTRANEDTLQLNADSTFIRVSNHCKGTDRLRGKWELKKKMLLLKHADTSVYKNISFILSDNILYRIEDATLSENNKKVKHLTLYKKQ